jgi:hypothetical protein
MEHGTLITANSMAYGELTEILGSDWDDICRMVSV